MKPETGKSIPILDGDFVMDSPEEGRWRDLGYLGIMHKCEACPYAARYGLRDGKRERYRCASCFANIKGQDAKES